MLAAALMLVLQPGAALAGWKIMPKGQRVAVAKSDMTVAPLSDWNR